MSNTAEAGRIIQAAPFILRRESAAAAMGVSVSLFEQQVRRGQYPQPRQLSDGASGWLYSELAACAAALPVSTLAPGPGRKKANQGAQTGA